MDVQAATEQAIADADHLTAKDAGAVEVLRHLAWKIATEVEHREIALRWADFNNMKAPAVDNVSVPTYLKFCESLGLTPAGRLQLKPKQQEGLAGDVGILAGLRAKRTG